MDLNTLIDELRDELGWDDEKVLAVVQDFFETSPGASHECAVFLRKVADRERREAAGRPARRPTKPEVGMGVTEHIGSDRYAGTIVRVSRTGHQIVYRRDKATLVSGSAQDGSAKYACTPDPEGEEVKATQRRNGAYYRVGSRRGLVSLGVRDPYRDPSF